MEYVHEFGCNLTGKDTHLYKNFWEGFSESGESSPHVKILSQLILYNLLL